MIHDEASTDTPLHDHDHVAGRGSEQLEPLLSNLSNADASNDTPTKAGGDFPHRIEAAYLESPGWVTVPRWVQLSGISPLARELAAELVDGANRVHGDMAPTLDREYLAWVVGVSRYDKIARALRELVDIDFLVIYSGGTDRHGNRTHRHDSRTGRKLPDTYGIRPNPPETYAGPRNTTEAYELFLRDRESARQRSGNSKRALSIPRQSFTRASAFPLDKPTPSTGGAGAPTTPSTGGTNLGTAGHSHTPCEGCGHTPCKGCGDVFPGHAHTPELRVRARRSESDLLSEERRGDLTERANAGAPEAPATPAADDEHHEVAESIASGLDWQATATRLGATLDVSRTDWAALVDAIASRLRTGEVTTEVARNIAETALGQASKNPVAFVARAFGDDRTFAKQRSLADRVVLAEPVVAASQQENESAEHRSGPTRSATSSPTPVLPACSTCGAEEGEEPAVRQYDGPDGRAYPCPCRTATAA